MDPCCAPSAARAAPPPSRPPTRDLAAGLSRDSDACLAVSSVACGTAEQAAASRHGPCRFRPHRGRQRTCRSARSASSRAARTPSVAPVVFHSLLHDRTAVTLEGRLGAHHPCFHPGRHGVTPPSGGPHCCGAEHLRRPMAGCVLPGCTVGCVGDPHRPAPAAVRSAFGGDVHRCRVSGYLVVNVYGAGYVVDPLHTPDLHTPSRPSRCDGPVDGGPSGGHRDG